MSRQKLTPQRLAELRDAALRRKAAASQAAPQEPDAASKPEAAPDAKPAEAAAPPTPVEAPKEEAAKPEPAAPQAKPKAPAAPKEAPPEPEKAEPAPAEEAADKPVERPPEIPLGKLGRARKLALWPPRVTRREALRLQRLQAGVKGVNPEVREAVQAAGQHGTLNLRRVAWLSLADAQYISSSYYGNRLVLGVRFLSTEVAENIARRYMPTLLPSKVTARVQLPDLQAYENFTSMGLGKRQIRVRKPKHAVRLNPGEAGSAAEAPQEEIDTPIQRPPEIPLGKLGRARRLALWPPKVSSEQAKDLWRMQETVTGVNPEVRAAVDAAGRAKSLNLGHIQWLSVDDAHHITQNSEATRLVLGVRFLSRQVADVLSNLIVPEANQPLRVRTTWRFPNLQAYEEHATKDLADVGVRVKKPDDAMRLKRKPSE